MQVSFEREDGFELHFIGDFSGSCIAHLALSKRKLGFVVPVKPFLIVGKPTVDVGLPSERIFTTLGPVAKTRLGETQ